MTTRQAKALCGCLVFVAVIAASAHGQDKKRDATVREVLALKHDESVAHVAISPDGKRILGVCETFPIAVMGHVKVWDTNTGKLLLTLKYDKHGGVSVAEFSPDGKRITGVCWDNSRTSIKTWDAATGKVVTESVYLDHPMSVRLPLLSPDRKRLFSHADITGRLALYGTVTVWDAGTGKSLRSIKADAEEVRGLAVSADGKLLATASADRTLRLWDLATGKEVRTLKGHAGPPGPVAFSPDGKRLVSSGAVTDYRWDVNVWDIDTGKVVFDLDMKGLEVSISSVAFSSDGKLVAAGENNGAMKIWDAATGKAVVVFKAYPKREVRCIAFHPDGKRIVTGADDKQVKVWELNR
jgi:WD40 repeat protein